jgi:hypothetical protein
MVTPGRRPLGRPHRELGGKWARLAGG